MVPNSNSTVDRRTFLKLTGGGGLAATAGCLGIGGDGGGDGPIVFGQPASVTGDWDYLQPGISQATDAALEQINDAGGPLGRELQVERRDTAVDPQEARTVTQQLIENDDAIAILGLFSSEINPLWDFIQEQEMPVVTPWPGSAYLDTRGGDMGTPDDLSDDEWVWRTVIGDTVHTAGGAFRALEQGHDTMGIINGTAEGARSWVEGFRTAYEANGGTVATQVEVNLDQSSYQSALENLFSEDFSAFAVSMPLESATTLMSDWSDGGYGSQPVLSDPLAQNSLAEQVGSDLDGAWACSPGQAGPSFDSFLDTYEDAGDAELNGWTPPAWDAINVAALAVHRAGEATPEAIEQNLGPVTRGGGTEVTTFEEGMNALDDGDEINYQGAASPTNFTDFGNVIGPVVVSEAGGGEFSELEVIPAEDLSDFVPEGEY